MEGVVKMTNYKRLNTYKVTFVVLLSLVALLSFQSWWIPLTIFMFFYLLSEWLFDVKAPVVFRFFVYGLMAVTGYIAFNAMILTIAKSSFVAHTSAMLNTLVILVIVIQSAKIPFYAENGEVDVTLKYNYDQQQIARAIVSIIIVITTLILATKDYYMRKVFQDVILYVAPVLIYITNRVIFRGD